MAKISAADELLARFRTDAWLALIMEVNGAWGRTRVVIKADTEEAARKKLQEKYPKWEVKSFTRLTDMQTF